MQTHTGLPKKIIIRDTTLREGLDVPGVERRLTFDMRIKLARAIFDLGVREFDIVHPGRVNAQSVALAKKLKQLFGKRIVVHGGTYAFNDDLERELTLMLPWVDDIDFVMSLVTKRPPHTNKQKIDYTVRALSLIKKMGRRGGVGFANATQCSEAFLMQCSRAAVRAGAEKIIVYDSVGLWDPADTYRVLRKLKQSVPRTPILFHCHNDLGLAVADSVAAAYAGATYLDASMNGLGDRAGNASLEQLATIFALKHVRTGIDLSKIRAVSDLTEKLTGIKRAVNHPITGDRGVIFSHISPKHIPDKKSFEILPKEILRS